jgi:hypothetical protein
MIRLHPLFVTLKWIFKNINKFSIVEYVFNFFIALTIF